MLRLRPVVCGGQPGPSSDVAAQGRTNRAAQKPSAVPFVIFGACWRQASTYQLRPERSRQTPFHAGGQRQWSAWS